MLEGKQIDRYLLQRLLGGEGRGAVYLGENQQNGQTVAIKVVRNEGTDANAEATLLFLREITSIDRLDQSNILSLYDYGQITLDGASYVYLIMPYCQDGSLADWLCQRLASTPLALQDIAYLINQIALALQRAHECQIIHQSVKASNILLHMREGQPDRPDLLLADFGVGGFYATTASVKEYMQAAPAWIAPEQWEGHPVPASDQYSVAVLAYQLLTGQPTLNGMLSLFVFQHLDSMPPPPSALNPRLPASVDAVILRSLARNPAERFPTVSAFASALQQVISSVEQAPIPMKDQEDVEPPPGQAREQDQIEAEREEQESLASLPAPGSSVSVQTSPGPILSPDLSQGRDIQANLTISAGQAATGTSRVLALPNGRRTIVSIPAGTREGQVIRLENLGNPSPSGGHPGALLLTVNIHRRGALLIRSTLIRRIAYAFASTGKGLASKRELAFLCAGLFLLIFGAAAVFFSLNVSPPISITHSDAAGVTPKLTPTIQNYVTATVSAGQPVPVITVNRPTATQPPVSISGPYGGVLAFDDPLKDNSQGNGWEKDPGPDLCQFTNGAYLSQETQANRVSGCMALNTDFSDFAYQVQMTITSGDAGGVAFRGYATIGKLYWFDAAVDGSYTLLVQTGLNGNRVLQKGRAPAFHKGYNQSNTLAVVAKGATLSLFVNQQLVATVVDGTYSHGQVGIIASCVTHLSTAVIFTNAKVWRL